MRQRLTIRAATVRDVPTLAELLDVLGYPVQESAVRASLEAMFQDRRHAVAVAEVAGEVVGLQFAKGLAAERGVVRLETPVIEVHAGTAEPFLLALGFEPGGTRAFRWSVLEAKYPRVPVPR